MIVLKKINNNVAICRDKNQRELIAFGKGIGFPATPYELTDLKKIERTFYHVSGQYISLLNDLPYEVVRFTAKQMLWAQDMLPYELSSNFILTLADHIAFAVERTKKGAFIHMPSIYELEPRYPLEVDISRKFVAAIRDEYPEIADCVDRICDYYKNDWALDLHEEERLYLMLHVNRACSKEAI